MDEANEYAARRRYSQVYTTFIRVAAAVVIAGAGLAASTSEPPSRMANGGAASQSTTRAANARTDGIYAAEQAKRGEAIFKRDCAVCHREDLTGRKTDGGPPLRGPQFTSRWGGLSIQALLGTAEELMPERHPGSLERAAYIDVVSYILQVNGLPPGKTPLPTSPDALKKVIVNFTP